MDSQEKQVFGTFIAAAGTVLSAIGSTPSVTISDNMRNNFHLWGNVLQATGNGLEADGIGVSSLEKTGAELQSVGNITVVAGLIGDYENISHQKLVITGNWIQALGGAVSLSDELTVAGESARIIGHSLQIIGNSMQAIEGIYRLESESTGIGLSPAQSSLEVSGSWLQAVGSVLLFLDQIKEYEVRGTEQ